MVTFSVSLSVLTVVVIYLPMPCPIYSPPRAAIKTPLAPIAEKWSPQKARKRSLPLPPSSLPHPSDIEPQRIGFLAGSGVSQSVWDSDTRSLSNERPDANGDRQKLLSLTPGKRPRPRPPSGSALSSIRADTHVNLGSNTTCVQRP